MGLNSAQLEFNRSRRCEPAGVQRSRCATLAFPCVHANTPCVLVPEHPLCARLAQSPPRSQARWGCGLSWQPCRAAAAHTLQEVERLKAAVGVGAGFEAPLHKDSRGKVLKVGHTVQVRCLHA